MLSASPVYHKNNTTATSSVVVPVTSFASPIRTRHLLYALPPHEHDGPPADIIAAERIVVLVTKLPFLLLTITIAVSHGSASPLPTGHPRILAATASATRPANAFTTTTTAAIVYFSTSSHLSCLANGPSAVLSSAHPPGASRSGSSTGRTPGAPSPSRAPGLPLQVRH